MREKELRLALVCYGGVSLAVYMHGTTKEVWKLARASMRRHAEPGQAKLPPAQDSEVAYGALLDAMGAHVDLRVFTDIVAGASAGGINGILLAQAISRGHDMEPLRALWLEGADSDQLLDAAGASRRFSKLWALPLIWYARRRGFGMDDIQDPDAREEVSRKLSRLMRSRWFHPPFSGAVFSETLYTALEAMAAGERTPPLLPGLTPLDLFVTVTDYHGAAAPLHLHSPPEISENEHRLIISFNDGGGGHNGHNVDRNLADMAELAFAARATASFPGAFPPARVGEMDAVLAARKREWPGREAFLARIFPGRANPNAVTLIDGSVLNSRPFGPAIEALPRHPAHREVDRRFVYVDPKPGMQAQGPASTAALPGFFSTVLRSLADIPRQQPINDNLATIEQLSRRVRRLRHVVDGMAPQVDAAIAGAVGARFFLFSLTPERLAEWRSRTHTDAAKAAGFAYAAYGQLKLAQIAEGMAAQLATLGELPPDATRAAVWEALRAQGLDQPAQAQERGGAASAYVTFLRSFDLDFRIRRLRFLIRRINTMTESSLEDSVRTGLEAMKTGLYDILELHVQRRAPGWFGPTMRAAAAATLSAPDAAIKALARGMALETLDANTDARLVALFAAPMPRGLRRTLLSQYLGFPYYDIATLPLLQGDGADEFDEIKVDRMSPEDSLGLRAAGGGSLKGARFNAFGAFFSRAYREHDYLWGRLHGAERLIDIVASTMPVETPLTAEVLAFVKRKAFLSIIEAERPHLKRIPDLFTTLDALLIP